MRAREQFLSIASHELRTPVTIVQGYVQGLQRLVARQIARSTPPEDPDALGGAADVSREAGDWGAAASAADASVSLPGNSSTWAVPATS